jgi:hypothetical protein
MDTGWTSPSMINADEQGVAADEQLSDEAQDYEEYLDGTRDQEDDMTIVVCALFYLYQ